MTDPLARLIEEAWNAARSGSRTFTEEAAYIRARRADVLRALYPDLSDAITDLGLVELDGGFNVNRSDGRLRITYTEAEDRVWVQPATKESR